MKRFQKNQQRSIEEIPGRFFCMGSKLKKIFLTKFIFFKELEQESCYKMIFCGINQVFQEVDKVKDLTSRMFLLNGRHVGLLIAITCNFI